VILSLFVALLAPGGGARGQGRAHPDIAAGSLFVSREDQSKFTLRGDAVGFDAAIVGNPQRDPHGG
jgi:hypothetical protein